MTLIGLLVRSGGGKMVTELPASLVAMPASPEPVFLKLTFQFLTSSNAILMALPLILTEKDGVLDVLLLADEIKEAGELEALIALVRTKLAAWQPPGGAAP